MIRQVMEDGFVRQLTMSGAFDKRHPDPNKNYGIHGMEFRFVLIGPKGATQFVVYSGMQLPHVQEEFEGKSYFNRPMGADIGYRAKEPHYEGQIKMNCDLIEGGCYYDGSGLQADMFMETFLGGGDDVVWTMLRQRYDELFGE